MRKQLLAGVCGTLALLLIGSSAHADLRKDIAQCAVMKGDLDRLSCFDQIAKGAGLDGPQALPVKTDGTGKWKISRDKNPIDDTERVSLMLIADSGGGRHGEPVIFFARCQSEKTEAFINWNTFVGDDSNSVYSDWKYVTVRIGSENAERQRWGISTSKDATFAPQWAGNLLKKMSKSDRLIAQLTPYAASPITATFSTAGLSNALQPLMKACKWNLD